MTQEGKEKGSLRKTFDSARQVIGKSVDKATGTEFRRQFEEFTDAVTTTVLGIHRDQSELRARLSKLEDSKPAETSQPETPTLVMWAFTLSLLAVVLSSAALVVAVS